MYIMHLRNKFKYNIKPVHFSIRYESYCVNTLSKFKHGPSKSVLQQYKTSFLHKVYFTFEKNSKHSRKLEDFFKIV